VCLALIGVSFGLRCIYAHNDIGPWFLYALTPFRVEPLAVGSLAAVLVRNSKMLPLLGRRGFLFGMAMCGLLMLYVVLATGGTRDVSGVPMATYGFTSFAIVYGSLVLYAYTYSGSSKWLVSQLRNPMLRAFGKYSYALYVFHVPVFRVCGEAAKQVSAVVPEYLRLTFWLLALMAGIGLSYGVALLSWHLVEKRFLAFKDRFSAKYS
jgi:peptidoglycan/LPS O-acetylase OafA/YrhL